MKKQGALGYGFKLSRESFTDAICIYGGLEGLHRSRKEVREEIVDARKNKTIHKNSKPQVFKIVAKLI